jgi:hypothetical protein
MPPAHEGRFQGAVAESELHVVGQARRSARGFERLLGDDLLQAAVLFAPAAPPLISPDSDGFLSSRTRCGHGVAIEDKASGPFAGVL